MRFLKFAVLAAFLMIPSSADAGILENLLTFNGVADDLVDQSVDSFLDLDGSSSLSAGDVLFGIAQIDQVAPDGGSNIDVPPARIGVAFAAEVESFVPAGTIGTTAFFDVALGVVTDPANNSLSSLLGTGFNGTLTDDTIFAVFEQASGPSLIDTINPSGAEALEIFNDTDFDLVLTGGIDPLSDDFFEASIRVNTVSEDFLGGNQRGGFTIFTHTFGGGAQFLPVDVLSIDGNSTTSHDITINDGSTISPADDPSQGFAFENNVVFSINGVPEPTSCLAFMGVLVLGLAPRRRLTSAKA